MTTLLSELREMDGAVNFHVELEDGHGSERPGKRELMGVNGN